MGTSTATTLLRRSSFEAGWHGTGLGLLGGFGLEHEGRAVKLPLSAQRLIAFLALRRRAVQRVYVAGMLWIDSTQDAANASLRTALWRLRRPTCPLVEATATHLALAPEVRVDVDDAVVSARRVECHDELESDVDRLVLAEELLPDWYDDWVILERERFRQLRLHALETLCGSLTAEGRYAKAVDVGLRAVACEPLRESSHRAVMRAHLAEGNHCDALRQYELFRRLLHEQLGLEPSALMARVLDGCASGDGPVTPTH